MKTKRLTKEKLTRLLSKGLVLFGPKKQVASEAPSLGRDPEGDDQELLRKTDTFRTKHEEYTAELSRLCSDQNYDPTEARKLLEEYESEAYPNEGLQAWALTYGELYAKAAKATVGDKEVVQITKKAIEIAQELEIKSRAHMFMLLFTLATLATGGVLIREMAWAICYACQAGVHDRILEYVKDIDNE